MTWEQYWYGHPLMARDFLEAERLRQKRQMETANSLAHLMGAYVYEVLADMAPVMVAFPAKGAKPKPYRDTPFELEAREAAEAEPDEEEIARREEAEALRAKAYMMQMMRSMNGYQGESNSP